MENASFIPLPNFSFSSYIKRKAEDYCLYNFYEASFRPDEDIKDLQTELFKYDQSGRIQFIGHIIVQIIQLTQNHSCNNLHCTVEQDSHDILYYLYKQLDEYGLQTDVESFSQDEIYSNNDTINEIIVALNEIKAGQEIIFTELDHRLIDTTIADVEDAKGLQVLGKSKWLKYMGGIVVEFVANKSLEGIFKAKILPLMLKFGFGAAKYLSS